MATRATKGGQVGCNGEFYKGGEFLPSTQLPKRGAASRKAASHRALVKPGVIDVVPAGAVAIFPRLQHFVVVDGDKLAAKYADDHTAIAYHFDSPAELHRLIELFNAGTLYEIRLPGV